MPVVAFILVGVLIVLYLLPSTKAEINEGDEWLVASILTALAFHGVITYAQKDKWSMLSIEELQKELTISLDINQEFDEYVKPFLADTPELILTETNHDGYQIFDG